MLLRNDNFTPRLLLCSALLDPYTLSIFQGSSNFYQSYGRRVKFVELHPPYYDFGYHCKVKRSSNAIIFLLKVVVEMSKRFRGI
jgi:hypothetical protein